MKDVDIDENGRVRHPDYNKLCLHPVMDKELGKPFLRYCGKSRTGITGLIPFCEEHYQKIWGKK